MLLGTFEQTGLFLMAGFWLVLALGVEVVTYGIRQRLSWAWLAGACIFAVYVFSMFLPLFVLSPLALFVPALFLPLGGLGLWGLMDAGSRATLISNHRGGSPVSNTSYGRGIVTQKPPSSVG